MSADVRRIIGRGSGRSRIAAFHALLLLGLFLLAVVVFSSPGVAPPPVVTLLSPTGGEDWTGGSTHAILWSVSAGASLVPFWINVSADNGSTWSTFANGNVTPDGSNRTTSWPVPLVNTLVMKVQVCASFNGTTCISSLPFRVDSTPPIASPAPFNGQSGVGVGSAVQLTFSEPMRTTAPALAAVVFSPFVNVSSITWTNSSQLSVVHGAFAYSTTYTWYVDCSILDASNPGNPVAGCGSPLWSFTTAANLPPAVTLSSPVGGEDWTGGFTHPIGWSVADPDTPTVTYSIAYSSDNGTSWSPLAGGSVAADGSNRSFPWSTPSLTNGFIRVRLCASDGTSLTCIASSSFRLDSTRPLATPWPAPAAVTAARGAFIIVNFSEPMQTTLLPPTAVTFVPALTVTSLTWASPTELLVYHSAFVWSVDYTWYVNCSVRDASDPGNPAAGCGSSMWSFHVNSPPAAVALAVDGISAAPYIDRIPNAPPLAFSWGFFDPDVYSSQVAYEWQVLDAGGSSVGVSGTLYGASLTTVYSGPDLVAGSCYTVQVRLFDGVDWGDWASLGFCLEALPPVGLGGLAIPFYVEPTTIIIVVASGLGALVWPRRYRIAELTGVAGAVVAVLIDLSLMTISIQPLRFDLSPGYLAAAVLAIVPVVIHFLPEAAGASLDPEPVPKIGSHGLFGALMTGLGVFVFPPALPVAVVSVASDFDLAASIGARLWTGPRPPAA